MSRKFRARTIARAMMQVHEVNDGDFVILKKNEWAGDILKVFESLRHALSETGRKKCVAVIVDDFDDIAVFGEKEMRSYGWCRCE